MLRITTTNGDELYHADQQPDAMSMTAYDGSQVLVHAGEWGHHKYIRKEGNRYIYPEDLVGNSFKGQMVKTAVNAGKKVVDKAKHKIESIKSANSDLPKGWKRDKNGVVYNEIGAISIPPSEMNRGRISQTGSGRKDKKSSVSIKNPISQVTKPVRDNAKNSIKGAIEERKKNKAQKKKDQAYVEESKRRDRLNPSANGQKGRDQITSAHQTSTAKTPREYDPTNSTYMYRIADGKQQAALKKERDYRKKRAKEIDQINQAHQGSTSTYTERDEIGEYRILSWRDGEKSRANKAAEKERHKRNSEHISFKTEAKKSMNDTQRQFDQMSDPSKKPKSLETQKKKTAQRKKAQEILDQGFKTSQAEEERRKAGSLPEKKRPRSRVKRVVSGGNGVERR